MKRDFGYPYGVVEVPVELAGVEPTEVADWCPGCEAEGTILPGHCYCWPEAERAIAGGARRVAGPYLSPSGWYSLLVK